MRQRNWWTSPCSYEGIKRFSLLPPPWIQRCMLDLIRSCSSTTAALRRLWVVRHQPQSGEKETLQTAPRVGQDPWRRFTTHYVCLLWTDTSYRGDKYSPLSFSPLSTNSNSQNQKYGSYSSGTKIARSSAEFAKAMLSEWCCTALPCPVVFVV